MSASLRRRLLRSLCLFLPLVVTTAIPAAEPVVGLQVQRMLREAAVVLLKEGNARFASDAPQHPAIDSRQRKLTAAEGQTPLATVLACSDSRVPVEMIFDRGIGEIFTVRVAGNVAGTDEVASIEYGVGHLHTPLLVVLGHTRCGAVTAALGDEKLPGLLPQVVDSIRPAVERARSHSSDTNTWLPRAVEENVWEAMSNILRRSSIVRDELRKGMTRVEGAVYDIESGKVTWLGEHPGQGSLVEEPKPLVSNRLSRKEVLTAMPPKTPQREAVAATVNDVLSSVLGEPPRAAARPPDRADTSPPAKASHSGSRTTEH